MELYIPQQMVRNMSLRMGTPTTDRYIMQQFGQRLEPGITGNETQVGGTKADPADPGRYLHPKSRSMSQSVNPCRFAALGRFAAPILLLTIANASAATLDYGAFDELLLHHVRDGLVDHEGIEANPQFRSFVQQVGEIDAGTLPEHNDQLTFYINAYNVLVIQGILDGYSPAKLFGRNKFFKSKQYIVMEKKIDLFDLERKILIPMGESGIHFAIVCASTSCPALSNRAYLPETLDRQLDEAARRFVNDISRNHFDLPGRTAYVSKIFDWYREEFEATAGSLQRFLASYVENAEVAEALGNDKFDIRFLKYDWNLNGQYGSKSE